MQIKFGDLHPKERCLVENEFCYDFTFEKGFLRIWTGLDHSVCQVYKRGSNRPYIIHEWLEHDRAIASAEIESLNFPKGKWHDYDQAATKWCEILRRAGDLSPVLFGEPYPNRKFLDSPIFMQDLTGHIASMWARVQEWIYPFSGGFIALTIDDQWMRVKSVIYEESLRVDLVPSITTKFQIDSQTATRMRITQGLESGFKSARRGFLESLLNPTPRSEVPHEACHAYWKNLLIQAGDLRPTLVYAIEHKPNLNSNS